MLIDIRTLKSKYDMEIEGVIHVGAHLAEEARVYADLGVSRVFWIEGNPDLIPKLEKIASKYRHNKVINALVTDEEGADVDFNIANNGQSSSVLELKTHLREHPEVHYVGKRTLMSRTLDSLAAEHHFGMSNFMNIDLQGAELLALKGATDLLARTIDYVYTEVNTKELYAGCVRIDTLDAYLHAFGFCRFDTEMTRHGWGDALYIKQTRP
jgi:FkbM family methyltransferase